MKTFATLLLLAAASLVTRATEDAPVGRPVVWLKAYDNVTGGKAPYHDKPLNANGNRFWLLKKTTKVPCDQFGTCIPGQKAIFLSPAPADIQNVHHNATFFLNSENPLPYGQQTYIAPDGAFSFVSPGKTPPKGSITTGFQGGDIATFQVLNPDHSGAILYSYACKEGDAYGVYFNTAPLPKHCERMQLLLGGGYFGASKYL